MHKNIIQLMGKNGDVVGLYVTQRRDEENFQKAFDEALAHGACIHADFVTDDVALQQEADFWLAENEHIYRYNEGVTIFTKTI